LQSFGSNLKELLVPRSVWCLAALLTLLPPPRVAAQLRPPYQVGVHAGFDFTNGGTDNRRIGVQGSIPLRWLLTLDPAFSYLYDFPDDPTGTVDGSAWQGYLTVRVHPFGPESFLSLGYGLTVVHASVHATDGSFSGSDTDATDVAVLGVTLPKGRVRPFAEVYALDLLERRSAVGGHLLAGVNVRLP
jgi:hypothetical protein